MSHLAWVDFDRDAQRAAREAMAHLNAPEARDELGLGTVRDGLADLLFPGTSTIHTRVHYMLFVPWIWHMAAKKATPDRRLEYARKLEFQLASALVKNGEMGGVIGRIAGKGLKRLPSGVYWAGLERWRIRRGTGSPGQTLRAGMRDGLWADDLPDPPADFPNSASFILREEDADFLRDRIVSSGTVFADLALHGAKSGQTEIDAASYAWQIDEAAFSAGNQHLLALAEGFARGMQGARLLYNLIAAERVSARPNATSHQRGEALVETYSKTLEEWAQEVEFDTWQPDKVYEAVRRTGRNPKGRLRTFVAEWIALARSDLRGIATNATARTLVIKREKQIKPPNTARLSNDSALARWGGESGAGTLDYRWGTARQFLTDISHVE